MSRVLPSHLRAILATVLCIFVHSLSLHNTQHSQQGDEVSDEAIINKA